MNDEIQLGKLSAAEKRKAKKDFEKIKKELKEQGIDADIELAKIKKIKKEPATIKMTEDLKYIIDEILTDAKKSQLKEKGADEIVHVYDEYNKEAPYISVIFKTEGKSRVENLGIKKGGEIFDVDTIRKFFLKQMLARAEKIHIKEKTTK